MVGAHGQFFFFFFSLFLFLFGVTRFFLGIGTLDWKRGKDSVKGRDWTKTRHEFIFRDSVGIRDPVGIQLGFKIHSNERVKEKEFVSGT